MKNLFHGIKYPIRLIITTNPTLPQCTKLRNVPCRQHSVRGTESLSSSVSFEVKAEKPKNIKMQSPKERKILIALDFDHTVINENSDTYVYNLAPEKRIPPELRKLYQRDGWTHYMGEVFKFLHRNGVKREEILKIMEEIPLTDGMQELFSQLPGENTEYIIISDSNSIFIDHIMICKGIKEKVTHVFTNPAHFDEDDCLKVEMFHYQDKCPLSTKNLCKGRILSDYVDTRGSDGVYFSNIAYVGDGEHDFCPCLRLQEMDLVFPRKNYNLEKTISRRLSENSLELKAKVYPWTTGREICDLILPLYKKMDATSLLHPRLRLYKQIKLE